MRHRFGHCRLASDDLGQDGVHVGRGEGAQRLRPHVAALAERQPEPAEFHQRVRAGLGYVPQGREIFGRLSVIENLQMGLASQPAGTPLSVPPPCCTGST